jgi:hypothetical protein
MSDKERVEAYLTLSAQLYKQHDDRRSLEWKIHLALWTLLVAAGYAMIAQQGKHLGVKSLILLFTIPIHFVWCIKMHRGLLRELRQIRSYRKAVESILAKAGTEPFAGGNNLIDDGEIHSVMPEWLYRKFASYWWWLGVEVVTTLLVAAVVILLAW